MAFVSYCLLKVSLPVDVLVIRAFCSFCSPPPTTTPLASPRMIGGGRQQKCAHLPVVCWDEPSAVASWMQRHLVIRVIRSHHHAAAAQRSTCTLHARMQACSAPAAISHLCASSARPHASSSSSDAS